MDTLIKLKYYAQCLQDTLNSENNKLNLGVYMELVKQLDIFLHTIPIQDTDISTVIQEDGFLLELKADLKRKQVDSSS